MASCVSSTLPRMESENFTKIVIQRWEGGFRNTKAGIFWLAPNYNLNLKQSLLKPFDF